MRIRKAMVWAVMLMIATMAVHSLDNRVIDALLEEDVADVERTIYLAMLGGEDSSSNVSVEQTVQDFQELGFKTRLNLDDPVTVRHFAHIVMQTMEIPGGVMYRIFGSPRYAFRDMVSYGILPQTLSPADELSGEAVVALLGNVLAWKETYQ